MKLLRWEPHPNHQRESGELGYLGEHCVAYVSQWGGGEFGYEVFEFDNSDHKFVLSETVDGAKDQAEAWIARWFEQAGLASLVREARMMAALASAARAGITSRASLIAGDEARAYAVGDVIASGGEEYVCVALHGSASDVL